MVFLHLSDLHLGKRMNGYSLIEDQRFFLFDVVLKECEKRGVRLILIAGDVYDVASPSAEATTLFSDFLDALSRARTRKKSFSFFHHYLSLFLISYIIPLTASEISRVIDE